MRPPTPNGPSPYEAYLTAAVALAARIGVPAAAVPTRDLPSYEGAYVEERAHGTLSLVYTERGLRTDIGTGDADHLVFLVLRQLTREQALAHELRNRRKGEDSRRQWFADHERRMAALDPAWGAAVRREYEHVLFLHPFDDRLARRAERWGELMAQGMDRANAVAQAERELP